MENTMAVSTETKMILDRDGVEHQYSVTQMAAKPSMKLKLRLTIALAPGLGGLKAVVAKFHTSGGLKSTESPEDQARTTEGALDAIEKILITMDPDEAVDMVEYMLTSGLVVRDGEKVKTIAIYSGDLMELYKAAGFVLKVNYADFFGVLEKLNPTSPKSVPAPTE